MDNVIVLLSTPGWTVEYVVTMVVITTIIYGVVRLILPFLRACSFTYCVYISAYQKSIHNGSQMQFPGIMWFIKTISLTTYKQMMDGGRCMEVISPDFQWNDIFDFLTFNDFKDL